MSDLLKRVYQAFDPSPLCPANDDRYVDLDEARGDSDLIKKLANRIKLADNPTCQILAGHRGSGKSTELRRLQCQLMESEANKVFVVFCECGEDIDRNDVDFPDILIAIVRQLASQLKAHGITLKPGYFKNQWDKFKHLLGNIELADMELSVGLLKLSTAIKGSPNARLQIRQFLEPDTANWIYAANDVIGEAKSELAKKGYEDLAIIVDDLDKMVLRPHLSAGCSTGEYLFVNREPQLRDFACHMIYTMPLALAYSAQERVIASLYGGNIPVVPMTQIETRHRKKYEPGLAGFREIINRRLKEVKIEETEVFENDNVREKIIKLSAGQPRELMILIRESIVTDGLPITSAAVARAEREARNAYARQLRAEHWPVIEQVRKTRTLERTENTDDICRDLLDSRAVLQYRNADEWYAVNPLVPERKQPRTT